MSVIIYFSSVRKNDGTGKVESNGASKLIKSVYFINYIDFNFINRLAKIFNNQRQSFYWKIKCYVMKNERKEKHPRTLWSHNWNYTNHVTIIIDRMDICIIHQMRHVFSMERSDTVENTSVSGKYLSSAQQRRWIAFCAAHNQFISIFVGGKNSSGWNYCKYCNGGTFMQTYSHA